MQIPGDDKQCNPGKLQEAEEEPVNSMDRLQKSLWQCTLFLDTQVPQDIQGQPTTDKIHRRKHVPMEDQHGTSLQGWKTRDRTN